MKITTIALITVTSALFFGIPIASAHDDPYGHRYTGWRYESFGNPGYGRFERRGYRYNREWAREHRQYRRELNREWRKQRFEVERKYDKRRREAWRDERHRYGKQRHRTRYRDDDYLSVILYLSGQL